MKKDSIETALDILGKHQTQQSGLITFLSWKVAAQAALLADILNEVNRDYAHGGPSRLSEELIQRIEEIILEK